MRHLGWIPVISEATAVIYRQAAKHAAALQSYAEGTILPPIRLNEKKIGLVWPLIH